MPLPCARPRLPAAFPFTVTELPCRAKLDQNESAVDLPADLKRELVEEVARRAWNRYPQPAEYREAKRRLAAALGLPPESVCLTAGCDQAILAAFHFAGGPGRRARWFEPTYPYVAHASAVTHTAGEPIALAEPFEAAATPAALLGGPEPDLVALVAPNNPTGGSPADALVDAALADERRLVFLDEAYADFAGATRIAEAPGRVNLLVGRSVSKAMLAGVRLGFCVGHPEMIAPLETVFAAPYHLNHLQLAVAGRYGDLLPHLRAAAARTALERDRVHAALARVPGIRPHPSRANFLLFRVDGAPERAAALHRSLTERGIRVRNVGALPGLAGWLRVTIGLPGENDAFLQALAEPATGG